MGMSVRVKPWQTFLALAAALLALEGWVVMGPDFAVQPVMAVGLFGRRAAAVNE